MKTTKKFVIPAGLSGVMDYSHIAEREYPISVKDGYSLTLVVEEASDSKLVVYCKTSDNFPDVKLLMVLRFLELANIFEKTVYYM